MPGRRVRRRGTTILPGLFSAPKPRPARRAKPIVPGQTRKQPAKKVKPPGAGRWLTARYLSAAGSRPYAVYVPHGLRRTTPAPLLVLLHGCGQGPADFAAATRFNQLADRHGVVLLYPEQTTAYHAQRCWRWFERAHQGRTLGEPALLAGLTQQVVADTRRWRIDPSRVYVAGLSAGGAMALVLGATYPDLYAAVGVHSAPPYRSAADRSTALRAMAGRASPLLPPAGASRMPPTIIFQGSADSTVYAVNAKQVAEQWLAFHQAAASGPGDPDRITRSLSTAERSSGGRRYTVTRWYTARGRKQLEAWNVVGLAHAWSGGAASGSFSDPSGPRASTEMWRFLAAYRLVQAGDSPVTAARPAARRDSGP